MQEVGASGGRTVRDSVGVPRQLLPALVGVFALMIATLVAIAWMGRQQDLIAQDAARRMVSGSLQAFDERTRALLLDYAIWTDAYDRVRSGDADWMAANIGAAAESGTFDLVVLMPPDGLPVAWGPNGIETDPLEPPAIAAVSTLLGADPIDSGEADVAYVRSNGKVWFLAMARVVPQDGLPAGLSDAELPRMLIGYRVTTAWLEGIGRRFMIDDLTVGSAPAPGMDSLALDGVDGRPVGHVSWRPPTPGRAVLKAALPPLLALMVAVAIVGLVVARLLVRSARRLEDALAEARAADGIKTEFLSNVSHELRTPLNGVIGVAQLLQMRPLDPEAREMLDILLASARSQLDLVNGLLDITRIESGNTRLDRAPFDPAAVLEDTVRMVAPEIAAKGLSLDMEIAPSARRPRLGDALAFRQIVTNIVNNALKFTDRGGITVRLETGDEGTLRFIVADTGTGIDPAQHARIFERFVQVDGAATRLVGGAGLGLAITHGLVEMEGGTISVASVLGEGAAFTVELPLPPATPSVSAA